MILYRPNTKFLIPVLIILVTLIFQTKSYSANNWDKFNENRSILGFTVGETSFATILKKLQIESPLKPEKKHELIKICTQNDDRTEFILFSTGLLHDYSTFYGIELSANNYADIKCKYNPLQNEKIQTYGGLALGINRHEILKILGAPSNKTGNIWIWNFENYESFKTPIIRLNEAGPTVSRYLMKTIIKGAYESSDITVEFNQDKLVKFSIDYYAESDFEIEHLDIKTGKALE